MYQRDTEEIRLVADVRPVNDGRLVHDNYPLPISEELLERMAGHKYYNMILEKWFGNTVDEKAVYSRSQ